VSAPWPRRLLPAGIRARVLLAFLLLVLVSAGAVGGVSMVVLLQSGKKAAFSHLESVTALKEAEIRSWLRNLQIDIMGLAEDVEVRGAAGLLAAPQDSPQYRSGAAALRHRFEQAITLTKRFEEMFLLSAQGNILVCSNQVIEGEFRGYQDYFRQGLREQGVHVQTVAYSPASEGVNQIIAVHPVRDDQGRTVGVLCGRANTSWINLIMSESTGFGQTGESYLVGDNHVLMTVSRFRGYSPLTTQVLTQGTIRALRERAGGRGVYRDYRGVRVYGVYRWLPDLRVVLLAEQDEAEVLQPAHLNLAVAGGVTLLAVVLAAGVALVLSRGLTAPLVALAGTAERIAAGDHSLAADTGRDDEIGLLARSFNDMTAQLRGLISDLERRLLQLQHTQAALAENEEKYRGIFENAVLGIYQVTLEGRMLSVNPAFAQILGYADMDEALARLTDLRHHLYVHPAERDIFLQRLRSHGTVDNFEVQLKRADGSPLWCAVHARLVRWKGGLRDAIIEGTLTDIDQRKRAERELARLNATLEQQVAERTDALERKAGELAEANRRLTELDQMKSAFLSSVSHELRTPLTSVLGFAKLIRKDFMAAFHPLARDYPSLAKKGRRIEDNLRIIRQEGERLTRMVNDFLDLSKIESGRVDWNDQDVAVETLVSRSVESVASQFQAGKGPALHVDVAPDLPLLRVDPDRVQQVVINLLSNAVKFTPRGEVSVTVRGAGGMVRLEVRDTGEGIPPQDLERIFDKFHQVRRGDTLGGKHRGTGLGLAICRQIVEHYGGRIWAESAMGEGSLFVVELPPADGGGQAAAPLPADPDPAVLAGSGATVILVVDDDPAIRIYLSQVLEGAGYAVVTAQDGESALDKARRYRPDLITMDILMPGLDGTAVIKALRRDASLRHVPVLVVTVLLREGFGGEDATLHKPVDDGQLLVTVRALLSRGCMEDPVLALRSNGPRSFPSLDAQAQQSIVQLGEEELWQRIESGFQGTVILSHGAAEGFDMERVARHAGVRVLILP
jgi:PAS domain S-box-containing protein